MFREDVAGYVRKVVGRLDGVDDVARATDKTKAPDKGTHHEGQAAA